MTQHACHEAEVVGAIACSLLPCASKEGCYSELKKHKTFDALYQHSPIAQKLAVVRGEAAKIYERSKSIGLEMVPLTSPRYPRLLRESSHPPFVLYVLSEQEEFSIPGTALGIVGTRAAPIDVCAETTLLGYELARAGITIISGLALGIDGAAHQGAVQAGGSIPTVAVLAHGLDRVYPRAHQALVGRIVEAGGVLVSEYAPGVEPLKHHFLERNRIIAALSRGVIVVQAGERSGSLVTATYALDYGRDVFVLDGRMDSDVCAGSRRLLDDGARVVRSAHDILSEYPEMRSAHVADGAAGPHEAREWTIMPLDELRRSANLSEVQLLTHELEGKIVRLPNGRVAVCRERS
jgi:DNA processing protein